MPYSKTEELPDGVKDSLPSDAQDIWMSAFNSAHGDSKDEDSCNKIAWGAVKNAGWAKGTDGKWAKLSAELIGKVIAEFKAAFPELKIVEDTGEALARILEVFSDKGDMEVEIFSVGKWNGDEYSIEDLHDMVKNFSLLAEEIKPPVKLGHSDEALNKVVLDGQPAYGWVTSLKVIGEKLVATFSHVPQILKKAIKEKRYRRVSSEIYWNLKKGGQVFKRVLGAVAYLGADAPAVTNLADLEALLTQSTDGSGSFERKAVYTLATEDGEHITQERRTAMPLTEEEKQELATLREQNVRLSAALDTSNKQTLQIRKNAAAERMRNYCEAQVKAGIMAPSTRDSIMKGIKEDKYIYSDEGDGSYALPEAMFKTVFDLRKPGTSKVTFHEQRGRVDIEDVDNDDLDGDGDEHDYSAGENGERRADIIVDREVKKYMTTQKEKDYSVALKAVLQSKPKLARAYVESTPIVRNESHAAQSADVDTEV